MRSLWTMTYALPADAAKGRKWTTTERKGVAAPTIIEALSALLREHPDATIWSASHQGKIEMEAGVQTDIYKKGDPR